MKIPRQLREMIHAFVAEAYEGRGLIASPSEIGSECGALADEFLTSELGRKQLAGVDRVSVVAFCERLGKHLGLFYLAERRS